MKGFYCLNRNMLKSNCAYGNGRISKNQTTKSMKSKYTTLAFVLATSLIALPALAQNTNEGAQNRAEVQVQKNESSSTLTNLRDRLQKQLEEKKQAIEKNNQEIKNTRTEINTNILNNRVRIDLRVFTATANRLDKIIARIESRVAKIQAAGGNTTNIEAYVNTGKTQLSEARTDITTISNVDLSSATSSTTVRTLLTTIKADAVKARDALKASRASLIQAVTLIMNVETKVKVKDSNVGDSNESTTTASTTVTNN